MTLKEELEILRGEPIEVFDGDPMNIPCIETSDAEKLCKHPVVSVHMITYNHEPYIRQAIEGVMMQKTDFEFELVIGEDCSRDKTREICFEYQRKYPDKIRVLWWHENVSKLGGNGRRNRAHCRGEFIAFCEGDDYWVDDHKLQKQVAVFREYAGVGLCFGAADSFNESTGVLVQGEAISENLCIMPGAEFNARRGCAGDHGPARFNDNQIRTMTVMCRSDMLRGISISNKDIVSWRLYVGDFLLWMLIASVSDVAFMPDKVAIYRIHPGGITSRKAQFVALDCNILRIWYRVEKLHEKLQCVLADNGHIVTNFFQCAQTRSWHKQISLAWSARKIKYWKLRLKTHRHGISWVLLSLGIYRLTINNVLNKLWGYWKAFRLSERNNILVREVTNL